MDCQPFGKIGEEIGTSAGDSQFWVRMGKSVLTSASGPNCIK